MAAIDIFFEIHSGNLREGPGDTESTRKALAFMTGLPDRPRILDLGCGPGMQTIDLARHSGGSIVAVDNHQPFLDELARRAEREGFPKSISTVNCSMDALPFEDEGFDVIWSEGAIYQVGFGRGLREWNRVLRRGGYVALTEISWLRGDTPEEPRSFWTREYPGIQSVEGNLGIIAACGYEPVAHFTLPDDSWWDNYYASIEKKLPAMEARYRDDPEAMAVIGAERYEMRLFRDYSAYYGYEFYVMRKP